MERTLYSHAPLIPLNLARLKDTRHWFFRPKPFLWRYIGTGFIAILLTVVGVCCVFLLISCIEFLCKLYPLQTLNLSLPKLKDGSANRSSENLEGHKQSQSFIEERGCQTDLATENGEGISQSRHRKLEGRSIRLPHGRTGLQGTTRF